MARRSTTTISGTSTDTVIEAGATVTGLATADGDLDAFNSFGVTTTFKTPVNLLGIYGMFTFNASSGVWTYLLDNTRSVTNALAAGQSAQDKLTIMSADGLATKDIVVTITGSNDAPVVIAGTPSATLVEAGIGIAGLATATITMSKSDPDARDTTSWSMTGWTLSSRNMYSMAGTYGNARFDASTGVVTYTLDNDRGVTDALISGQTVFDTFAIKARDKAGITTSTDAVFRINGSNDVVLDTTPPAALTLSLTSDTGLSVTDGITNNGSLTISTPEDGATVEYNVTNGVSGWSLTAPTPVVGLNTVYVRQTDLAGNVSAVSDAFNYTFDDVAPAAPTVSLTNDSGVSGDNITNSRGLTTLRELGAKVEFNVTNGASGWLPTSPIPGQGPNTVFVRQIDVAGNVSANTSINFTYDSTAPVLLAAEVNGNLLFLTYTDAGRLDATNLPDPSAFTVTSTGGALSALSVLSVAVNDADARVILTLSSAVSSTHEISVSYTDPSSADDQFAVQDQAGNDAVAITSYPVTNNTLPEAPAISATISSMTMDSGVRILDFITNDGREGRQVIGNISAALASSQIVQVSFDDGTNWIEAPVLNLGWAAIDTGVHGVNWTIRARVTDTITGLSGIADIQLVTFDNVAPTFSQSNPADEADNVGITSDIVLSFSESVFAGPAAGNILIESSSTDDRVISITDTARVVFSDANFSHNTITINPTIDLRWETSYSIRMASGVLQDVAGNAFAGIYINDTANPYPLNFQTMKPPLILGDMFGNTLNGTTGNDTIEGGGGSDTISGAGGNDTIIVPDLSFQSIDGGNGTDTLALSGEVPQLTVSEFADRISNIEIIDLTGSGANELILSIDNLLGLSSTSDTLRVNGDDVDRVIILVAVDPIYPLIYNGMVESDTYKEFTSGTAILLVAVNLGIRIELI